ncbi:MAG: galactose-1-phosphate uridylyltransferase [Pirellulales bacterium]
MSVMRFDEATSDWVVFAPSRRLRPHANAALQSRPSESASLASCPFCPGNEAFTPPEIYAVRDSGAWRVRVVPNKFPALTIEDTPHRRHDDQAFQFMGGCGAHEVIIESPDHSLFLGQQPIEQVVLLLRTLQQRYRDLMRDSRFQTVVIFKNHGAEAGTSLAHPHWQLLATPVVPRLLRMKHFEASEFYDRTGQCLYCDIVRRELEAKSRVLAQNEHYVAFLPFAGHAPFETWIAPRLHQASFQLVPAEHFTCLAAILKSVLLKLHTALGNPAFNLTIDDVPRGDEGKEYFLWHMRILPRLTTPAGFELGSGMSINTVLPEDAAKFLSEASTVEEVG